MQFRPLSYSLNNVVVEGQHMRRVPVRTNTTILHVVAEAEAQLLGADGHGSRVQERGQHRLHLAAELEVRFCLDKIFEPWIRLVLEFITFV